jgi:SAM-dependent methyltransferase
MSTEQPSMAHLERHQRDLEEYRTNVAATAAARFGPGWWGLWEQHISLPDRATLVDLGVGTGALLAGARARYPLAQLIGVDLHPALLELARENAPMVELVQADLALPVPLPDGLADVVTSSLTLHELPYPPALITNAARLLKPGGHFVLHDIVKWPLSVYLQGRELEPDSLDHFREHCLFTPDDLAWLVSHAGLRVDEVVTRQQGRFATVFARKPTDG